MNRREVGCLTNAGFAGDGIKAVEVVELIMCKWFD